MVGLSNASTYEQHVIQYAYFIYIHDIHILDKTYHLHNLCGTSFNPLTLLAVYVITIEIGTEKLTEVIMIDII